jgi:hypothetical protein
VSEPISPELVLVDPELARRERARLTDKARLVEYLARYEGRAAAAVQPPVVAPREPRLDLSRRLASVGRRKLLPAALLCSLLANGFFAAEFVARADKVDGTPVVQVAARPSVVTTRAAPTSVANPVAATRSPRPRMTKKAVVEHKLVALILTAPARKLPRAFIDPKTGLVRNNVQVVCRAAKRRSYLCTVRLANARGGKALVVRYRTTRAGRSQFAWYGYKVVK